ncbi:trigger factor [Inmirania thermothiophila]|uniref:Trigger factor n=1 Tax=Inmirania thermothiophila TaxID=1750597 RepID=A0A3N1XZG3_9GAMM|nr:trigger factor [Inmirania thermothiophila]ROR31994.1 trigger factor [Inmirania thermothiophila]
MRVTVEVTEGLGRRMKVEVPAETIEQEVESRLRSLAGRVKVPGFRPGKVPFRVVQRQFGEEVRREVIGDVMARTYQEALIKESLRPAGGPTIEPGELEAGKPFQYTATFEVYPEIELADPAALEIERPTAEVTDADIDAMIERLRRQRTRWEAVAREAREGDRVTIDFHGTCEGEEFGGNRAEEVPVVIGAGSLIPGFEEQLVGAKAGEERVVEVTFPEDYRDRKLAGRPARFEVRVRSVEEPVLPEVDAEFIRAYGIEDGDMERFRRELRANMERELADTLRAMTKRAVVEALLAANPVELPQALVKEEIDALRKQLGPGAEQAPDALFEAEARRRVAAGLLLGEAMKKAGIELDEARVRAEIERRAAAYEDPEEVVRWYHANPQARAAVEHLVLEEQIIDWLLEQAKVTERAHSFDEIMNPRQAEAA